MHPVAEARPVVPVQQTSPPSRGGWLAVAAVGSIALAGLLVKLPVLETVTSYWEDSYWFCVLAKNLEHGHYSVGGGPHARFFPGYPMAIAAVDLLTARHYDVTRLAAVLSAIAGSLA